MWMVRLGLSMIFVLEILKMNSLFISCNYTMQKRLPFVPNKQNVTLSILRFSICPSFISCCVHLPVFWIFPISRGRLETACWLTHNCSTSYFRVCESFSSNNACNSTCSNFLGCFPSCLMSKSPLLKCLNPRSHVSCDGAYSSWASRSNRYDSAAVFFKWKQKINLVRECSLFGVNFDTLNTTLCTHFSNLSFVRVWRLLKTQQNSTVSNLQSTNCSGAPSVVWNSHFKLVSLVY